MIECNEDGFTKENLQALCAVGKSSKVARHGYIGAKGIGFKSVFMAAQEVHIQSGYFSFYFKHSRSDDGLGMVTPIWRNATESLPDPLTRISLQVDDEGKVQDIEHLRKTIFDQFEDLQQTCLLFLRNIKQIGIKFFDAHGQMYRSRTFNVTSSLPSTTIQLRSFIDGSTSTTSSTYHVTKSTATGIPARESSRTTDSVDQPPASDEGEIVLAFPLTMAAEPVIEHQYIFAFLPLEKSSFKVSINILVSDQASFVTDLIKTSSSYKPTSTPAPTAKTSSSHREEIRRLAQKSLLHSTKPFKSSINTLAFATTGHCFCRISRK